MKRSIDTSIWGDPWFTELSAEGKMVFMYLLTNERSTAAGIFDLSPRRMAFDIGIDQSIAESALEECSGRVRWWPDHSIVWVMNFFRHQAVNDNFLKSAQRTFAELPEGIRQEVAITYPEFDANPSGTPPEPVPTGTQTPTHIAKSEELTASSEEGSEVLGAAEADASPKPKPKAKRAMQIPETWMPSDTVRKWAEGEGFTDADIDSQILRFVDHWRGEGKARKDWDATFRNWMRNAREWGHLKQKHPPGSANQTESLIERAKRERAEYEQARSNRSDGSSEHRLAEGDHLGGTDSGIFLVPGRRTG